jgi:hypothetical protein
MVCPIQQQKPYCNWPHKLNISETDMNSLDKYADILLCNFDKHGECLLTECWKL